VERLLRILVLAAVFGVTAWAGYALARPAPEAIPAAPVAGAPIAGPPAEAPAPPSPEDTRGDLDGGDPPSAAAPKAAPAKPEVPDGTPLRITFEDLTQWDLDPKDVQVPASIRALEGRTVDVVGYMLPFGNPEAVEEFLLVKDMGSCCFGAAPLPHHLIQCRFEEGKTMVYPFGPIRVRGKFRVEENRQGRFLVSVFAMTVSDCTEVR
jgi:hypothetical protein